MTSVTRLSPNHEPRPKGVALDMLVLHYTGMQTGQAALERLCDPDAKVSAHYVVDEDGCVYALVPEDRRAWHAGVSYWRGKSDVNSRSIGIELVNPGHEFGYRAFPHRQMESLIGLCHEILARHTIPPRNVVGHSDVAPARKADPGELFDWPALASAGIGLWPENPRDDAVFSNIERMALLRRWGYEVNDQTSAMQALVAFQRHFRPSCCDGKADTESVRLLAHLLTMVGNSD
jgi:N-acetylmuramoyl-L-alanine amidase